MYIEGSDSLEECPIHLRHREMTAAAIKARYIARQELRPVTRLDSCCQQGVEQQRARRR
jgi:hypothetical protein